MADNKAKGDSGACGRMPPPTGEHQQGHAGLQGSNGQGTAKRANEEEIVALADAAVEPGAVVVEPCHTFRTNAAMGCALVFVGLVNVAVHAALLLLVGWLVGVARTTGLLSAFSQRQGRLFQHRFIA